ncbi:MAG: radical SAM/SPASM domain-containing protein [Candidatus Hydrothermarchaeales archaeon]
MHPKLKNSALKEIETNVLYDFVADELYELDDESFNFLRYCTGRNSLSNIIGKTGCNEKEAKNLIKYLQKEGHLEFKKDDNGVEKFPSADKVLPSLRYLQLHITEKCNLNCKHCYLGTKRQKDLDLDIIGKVIREFSQSGLKLLITGGEPLLHDKFWEVLKIAKKYPIRVEVLSNGTLITDEKARRLSRYIHGIQISIDGLEGGHESLRGKGAFKKAIKGVKAAKRYLKVTCATMIHKGNVSEFPQLEKLMKNLKIDEWSIDIPSEAGNMAENLDLAVDFETSTQIFGRYGYSAGMHLGDKGYSCGSHICSVNVLGEVSKCGFFSDPVENVENETLIDCWRKIIDDYVPRLTELECKECKVLEKCRGGCRYRAFKAGNFFGKDPFMCHLYLES